MWRLRAFHPGLVLSLGLAGAGCRGEPAAHPGEAEPSQAAGAEKPSDLPARGPAASEAPPSAVGAKPAEAASDAGTPEAPPAERYRFPPPDVEPPHERSAEPGDGKWTPLAAAGDRAGEGPPVFYKTVIHPHEASRFITLTLVAVDLRKVEVRWLPGKEDVGERKVPFAPGLVPSGERERLLAAFNGGFQPRHGRWGMRTGDTEILAPRDIGCTLALYADGGVRLRSWPALSDSAAKMRALRQTPPCLVEEGEIHPQLLRGNDKMWGGKTAGIVTRRRSAVGLDRDGRVLYYGISIEATPRLLAEGMRQAGAVDAAELDVNWNWTRFFLFGKNADGELRVSSSLVEATYAKSAYVEVAQARDFFYVLRR